MKALNFALFQWMAAGHEPTPWLLFLASAVALVGPWVCMGLMGWVAWRRPAERGHVMASLAFAAAAGLLAHAIAAALDVPRPFMLGLSPAYIAHGARGSLPSSHASVMFTVALVFLLRPRLRDLGIAIAAIAAVTGWARIYVGVHFPADIAAGLLLAVGLAGVFVGVRQFCRHYLVPMIARDDLRAQVQAAEADPPIHRREVL